MAAALRGQRVGSGMDLSSGRPQLLWNRAPARHIVPNVPGPQLAGLAFAEQATALPARPPAGPSTVLCSSLHKERKKLAKVLKSHRKVLERRLSALTAAEVNAPVLSELLSELRVLTSRLEDQRTAALLYSPDSSDSSDSDEDCPARPAASLAVHHGTACRASCGASARQQALVDRIAAPATSSPSVAGTLVVHGLSGELELPVPEPQEGWDWNEDEFRSAKFEGAAGRIMVCTGSKCQRKGATEVLRAVSALSDGNPGVEVVPCKCVGKCSAGAAIRVRPQGQACATYTQVRPAQLRAVFNEHFGAGSQVPDAAPVACCAECVQP